MSAVLFPSFKYFRLIGFLALGFAGCSDSPKTKRAYQATPKPERFEPGQYFVTHHPERLAKVGPDACIECHQDEVEDWRRSHHADANRLISKELDATAFTPPRSIRESGVTYQMTMEGERFLLRMIDDAGKETEYELVGVIGSTPVRQYLAKAPGGHFQTISATYHVAEDKWIDVYEGEDRMPGEWGHWQGRGMNWNANCAYCHTTEFKKNYDFEADVYRTTWTQHNIACAECHTHLEAHVRAARSGNYEPGLLELTKEQTVENCASCHSRREQLTADAFQVGDDFEDHYALSLPDRPGLYFPDGQIRDEVYVYASFKMSRMGHAGVSCMDCHNPHTMEPILPTENNLLCMRCHETGLQNAPVIRPTEHSFHPAGSTGNLCVECHMPKRVYMQADPRADHGFHSPDPLLTKELGVPNACNDCHTDKSTDWTVEWHRRWYGESALNARRRKRARVIASAHAYRPEAMQGLLDLAKDEPVPAWQATYIGLLGNYIPHEAVKAHCQSMIGNEDPMVRNRAIGILGRFPDGGDYVMDALKDTSRSVRITASGSLTAHARPIPDERAQAEYMDYLRFNSDRPQSLFILGLKAAREGKRTEALKYADRAVLLDASNPAVYHQSAVLLNTAGLNDRAEDRLKTGWEMAPEDPQFPYALGLLAAESGDLGKAVGYLEETVALAPDFYRAWYNLSLAYTKLQRPEDAARSMHKARGNE